MAASEKTPEHQRVYSKIRELILFGEFAPGQPVTILGLRDVVGAGITPVREAIRRLVAEGAIQMLGNRRICVSVLDTHQFAQLMHFRLAIEPYLAGLAGQKAGNLALSAQLREIDDSLNDAIGKGDVRGYLLHNYRFHFCLYQAAEAPVLLRFVSSSWLQFGPSMRIVCGRYGTSNLPDNHDAAIDAMAAGAVELVSKSIRDDIRQGMELVGESLGSVHGNSS